MTRQPDKWERRGNALKEAGKLVNGIVWGSVLLAVIGYIAWKVTFS